MKHSFWRQLLSDILFVAQRDKKWWLVPLIFVLVGLSALFMIAAVAGPLAPFIYTLF